MAAIKSFIFSPDKDLEKGFILVETIEKDKKFITTAKCVDFMTVYQDYPKTDIAENSDFEHAQSEHLEAVAELRKTNKEGKQCT